MATEQEKEFGESFVDRIIQGESLDDSLEDTPVKRPKTKAKLRLVRLNGVIAFNKELVVCVDQNAQGYLVPMDIAPENSSDEKEFAQDDSRIELLYNWDKEIEAMLPSRAEMVNSVRLSLYRAGAYQSGDLSKNAVRQRGLQTAFPYKISALEE